MPAMSHLLIQSIHGLYTGSEITHAAGIFFGAIIIRTCCSFAIFARGDTVI